MENPIKMDDLGVPLFLETPICVITSKNEGCGFHGSCCLFQFLSSSTEPSFLGARVRSQQPVVAEFRWFSRLALVVSSSRG